VLRALVGTGRFLAWCLLSFGVVVALLTLAGNLPQRIRDARAAAERQQVAADRLVLEQAPFTAAARARIAAADGALRALRSAGPGALDDAERAVRAARAQAAGRVLGRGGIAAALVRGDAAAVQRSLLAETVELPLADRALAAMALRRTALARDALNRDIAAYDGAAARHNRLLPARDLLARQAAAQARNPFCRQVAVPLLCSRVRALRTLDATIAADKRTLDARRQDLARRKAVVDARARAGRALAGSSALLADATARYRAQAAAAITGAERLVWNTFRNALRRHGWTAFWIVIGAVVTPVLHKLFAFFVIAPLAARSRPIRLGPPGPPLEAGVAHVSVEVPLDRDTELFVRRGVQSAAAGVEGRSRLLLDPRMPITCLAAGLVGMQRLRGEGGFAGVTAVDDAHMEVALVTVPEGGAVTLQPRALVGLLKPRACRLAIRRPWRLRSPVAWITCQFRFVVFHGPCTLIVQGRRGVAVEQAGAARMINKRLTLGFDAGLAYGAARAPALLPYLLGRQGLFNDRFEGEGRFLYEQRAGGGEKGSLWGRGLKGLGDAVLSAFGV